jgi:tetratricopeptide (TPR) repeat protein
VGALAAWALLLARRNETYAIGLAWFALPLLPALDLRNFLPEDLLHDRYLYLAILGGAACAASLVSEAWDRWVPASARGGLAPAWAVALPVAILLLLGTRSYVTAWRDEVTLWERAVRINPGAAFPRSQLGEAYRQAGRLDDARRELTLAVERSPNLKFAHSSLGALAVQLGDFGEAERHLRRVLESYPADRPALEQLALAYQKQGRFDDAIALFERGRRSIPARAAIYVVNIAVLQRMAGRAREAEATLRSMGDALSRSADPPVLRAWWYLGELARERGDAASAVASYERYLAATVSLRDPGVASLREAAAKQIRALREAAPDR